MTERDWTPKDLLELSGFYWRTCALHAAVKLDVFSALDGETLTAEEAAAKVGADARAMRMLLGALVALGLLAREGEGFRNTESSRMLLSRTSPNYTGFIIRHHQQLMESWARLDQVVATGKPVRTSAARADEGAREAFLMGMFNLASAIAPGIARKVDLGGRRHLLDLGGGPGTYAIHFCLANPELRATVFDLPTTRPFAERTIERLGAAGRVTYQTGDFNVDPLPGRYDVAWLSHILHAEGPDTCQRLVDKVAAAMEPGGLVMIHEFVMNDSMDGPLQPALFSLNMLLGTERGQAYSEAQLRGMLERAGLRNVRRLDFVGPNESGIVMGELGGG